MDFVFSKKLFVEISYGKKLVLVSRNGPIYTGFKIVINLQRLVITELYHLK